MAWLLGLVAAGFSFWVIREAISAEKKRKRRDQLRWEGPERRQPRDPGWILVAVSTIASHAIAVVVVAAIHVFRAHYLGLPWWPPSGGLLLLGFVILMLTISILGAALKKELNVR